MSSETEPEPTTPRPAEPAEPGIPAVPAPTPESGAPPPIPEQPIPRGCNPLVFGVAMATIQLACTVYFMRSC